MKIQSSDKHNLFNTIIKDQYIVNNVISPGMILNLFCADLIQQNDELSQYSFYGYSLDETNTVLRKIEPVISRVIIGIRLGILYVGSGSYRDIFGYNDGKYERISILTKNINDLKAVWRIANILAKSGFECFNSIKMVDSSEVVFKNNDKSYTISFIGNTIIKNEINDKKVFLNAVIKPNDYYQRIKICKKLYSNLDALSMMLFESVSLFPRQHIFILCDDGGSGKTSLMEAFSKAYPLIVSGVTVQTLTGGSYEKGSAMAIIADKRVVFADEGGSIDNSSLQVLGAISTGLRDIARYGEGRREQIYVKAIPIIATNVMPNYDSISAFKRRTIIITNDAVDSSYWWKIIKSKNITVHDYIQQKETIDSMIFYGMKLFESTQGNYSDILKNAKIPVGLISKDLAILLDSKIQKPGEITFESEKIDSMLWAEVNTSDKKILRAIGCHSYPMTYRGSDELKNGKPQKVFATDNTVLLRKMIDKTLGMYDENNEQDYRVVSIEEAKEYASKRMKMGNISKDKNDSEYMTMEELLDI